ncbi:MAG: response regulator [Parasphingorhabdus sp.]|uniref:response regulator n=1 Tax=Parasphingorhabdus sp. TaxID=2709688 RepID=UPI0030028FBD
MARILIADDDALIGEVVSHILKERGHEVVVADDGAEALEMILLDRPDIIILDNLMPGLKGIEVFTRLQNRTTTATIPVIMLTAQTGRNHMVEAYDAGVTDYMTKPFEPACLADRISDIVDRKCRKLQSSEEPV